MKEYQVTFYVSSDYPVSCFSSSFIRVARKFKSTIHVINFTNQRSVELCSSLSLLSIGMKNGDLCQLAAFGLDAELACFVLKDLIAALYAVVRKNTHLEDEFLHHNVPFVCNWGSFNKSKFANKMESLSCASELVNQQFSHLIFADLIKRESVSSTCIANGLAIPHTISDFVDELTIITLVSEEAIDWESAMGAVHLVVCIIVPSQFNQSQLRRVTNLTRNLLHGTILRRLLMTRSVYDIRAILTYLMSRLIK
ncbi:PTS sugar transporter subunit IIA [Vibrio diazotrophicus]|uniref:PTS sugar transporter subunit IIA n=1 Tax=Vibrio diazotrophicus TaxID=685 RepID=UPI000C9EC525|nr:PTS sugar transporter subunit IIA [Vibrio diazotrophicus]PNH83408.1 PTS fructose transporter subunit IIA [Vibrio diazotrophicus]